MIAARSQPKHLLSDQLAEGGKGDAYLFRRQPRRKFTVRR
jgi:hypothetical protein